MMTKKKCFFMLLMVAMACFSCREEITTGRTEFPEIFIHAYELDDSKGFEFTLADANGVSTDFNPDKFYSFSGISFSGKALCNAVYKKNFQLKDDITEYLYGLKNMYYGQNVVHYITDSIDSVILFSDKDFDGIKAGESLNSYFSLTGKFIVFENGKYFMYEKNMLEVDYIQRGIALFPKDLIIKMKKSPKMEGRYKFFIRLKIKNRDTLLSLFADINLKK